MKARRSQIGRYYGNAEFAILHNSPFGSRLRAILSSPSTKETVVGSHVAVFVFQYTGHSLGGALATLTATDVSTSPNFDPKTMRVITFGAPSIGNIEFIQGIQNKVYFHFNVA